MMSNNFRTIYLYIVCFITLSMIIGGIVSTVNSITSYVYPDSYAFFEKDTLIGAEAEDNLIERQNYKNEKIKNTIVSIVVVAVGAIIYKSQWTTIENERNA